MPNWLKNLFGAAIGGTIGYFIFGWFLKYGFYAMIAPGGLIGVGGAWFRHRAIWLPFATGIFASVLSVFTEWKHRPFAKDESFGYFIGHLSDLTPVTWLMMLAGVALAFYLPWAQYRKQILAD